MWLGILTWLSYYLLPIERHQFLPNLFILFCLFEFLFFASLTLSAISLSLPLFVPYFYTFTLPDSLPLVLSPTPSLGYLKFQFLSPALSRIGRITRPFAPIPTTALACHLSSSFPSYLFCQPSLPYQLPRSQTIRTAKLFVFLYICSISFHFPQLLSYSDHRRYGTQICFVPE